MVQQASRNLLAQRNALRYAGIFNWFCMKVNELNWNTLKSPNGVFGKCQRTRFVIEKKSFDVTISY